MAHTIRSRGFLESRILKIGDRDALFVEGFSRNRFSFEQIDYVLMAADGTLSLQVGQRVFSVRARLDKSKHAAAVQALLDGVRAAQGLSRPIGPG